MYATNYYETMVLNTLRGTPAVAPANIYLALFLSNPGESGQEGTEISYTGYARQSVTFSAPAPISGNIGIQNDTDILFAKSTTSAGTVTHVGVMDSVSGGNMLLYGELSQPLQVGENKAPTFVIGTIKWWVTGNFSVAFATRAFNLLRRVNITGFTAHLALFGGNPDSGGAELSGGGYARAPITFSAPAEQPTGQMRITNSAVVQTSAATTDWGTLTHYAIMDAATAGTAAYSIPVPTEPFKKGTSVRLAEGDIALSVH